jgi:hypothetical protein
MQVRLRCDSSATWRDSRAIQVRLGVAKRDSAAEAAVGGAAAQLLAGAVCVVGHVDAVVLVEMDGRGGVELGLDGVGVGKLGLNERRGVRDLRGGAEGGDLGCGDAEVKGQLGRGGGGAEDDEIGVGGVDGGARDKAGGAGVGDGEVDCVALEAEDGEVLLGDEELVEGDVDERGVKGDSGQARLVDSVRRLAAAARDEVEGTDELLIFDDGLDAKGVMERDHVGVVGILATYDGVDAAEKRAKESRSLRCRSLSIIGRRRRRSCVLVGGQFGLGKSKQGFGTPKLPKTRHAGLCRVETGPCIFFLPHLGKLYYVAPAFE